MLVPTEYFVRPRRYGSALVRERLQWYHSRQIARVFTDIRVLREATAGQREDALERLERQRRGDLGLPPEVWR